MKVDPLAKKDEVILQNKQALEETFGKTIGILKEVEILKKQHEAGKASRQRSEGCVSNEGQDQIH